MCQDYKELVFDGIGIIYCDPPYEGTTGYNNKIPAIKAFNHAEKHEVFLSWAKQGHAVYASGFDYEFLDKPQYEILMNFSRSTAVTAINESRDKMRNECLAFVNV